jgi:hypothetical protein
MVAEGAAKRIKRKKVFKALRKCECVGVDAYKYYGHYSSDYSDWSDDHDDHDDHDDDHYKD